MIELYTFAELSEQQYTLALYCLSCDRWGEVNLDWLIQTGKGNKLVTEGRFRCRDCGPSLAPSGSFGTALQLADSVPKHERPQSTSPA